MTDFDLDRLGELWREDPETAQIERLRQSAMAVSRRGRLAQLADAIGAVVAGIGLVAVAAIGHNPKTFVAAGAALLLMLFSVMRNRKLREAEIRMLTGTTEEMLDQSIDRARARHKRMRFNLLFSPLSIPVILWMISTRDRGPGGLQAAIARHPVLPLEVLGVIALVIVGIAFVYIRSLPRSRAELERLESLRDAYRRERNEASKATDA